MAAPVTLDAITFTEYSIGTTDPVYSYDNVLNGRTFEISFKGVLVNDVANPTSPCIAANFSYQGPVEMTFNSPVSGISLDAGAFDAAKSTRVIIEGLNGFRVERVFNSFANSAYQNFSFDYGENVITRVRIVPEGDEPAGFAVDNVQVTIRPESRDVTNSGKLYIDNLIGGTAWNDDEITWSFIAAGSKMPGYGDDPETFPSSEQRLLTSAPFSAGQKAMTLKALGMWDDVGGMTFTKVSDTAGAPGIMRFGVADIDAPADAFLPGEYAHQGDVRIDVGQPTDEAQPGSYEFYIFIHEVGHALGLKHPHENSGSGVVLPANQDSHEFSIMSYRAYPGADVAAGVPNAPGSFPHSLMMNDIAAIQYLYGANFTHNAGNTTYAFDPGVATVFETIWDGGGIDTYDASVYRQGIRLDLNPGRWCVLKDSQLALLNGDAANPILARGSVFNARLYQGDERSMIENATGGGGDDTLLGNATANVLKGNGGDDRVDGLAGLDVLRGDNGDDKLLGGSGGDKLRGGGGGDELTGGLGRDRFIYDRLTESTISARDTIFDFEQGQDRIDLSATDANANKAGSQAWSFIGTNSFSAAGQLRYEQTSVATIVSGDTNGDGTADFVLRIGNLLVLAAGDFLP